MAYTVSTSATGSVSLASVLGAFVTKIKNCRTALGELSERIEMLSASTSQNAEQSTLAKRARKKVIKLSILVQARLTEITQFLDLLNSQIATAKKDETKVSFVKTRQGQLIFSGPESDKVSSAAVIQEGFLRSQETIQSKVYRLAQAELNWI